MAHIDYDVAMSVQDMSKATDSMLKLPIKISFTVHVGYLKIRCDNVEEAEKYLNYLREEEIKERKKNEKPTTTSIKT